MANKNGKGIKIQIMGTINTIIFDDCTKVEIKMMKLVRDRQYDAKKEKIINQGHFVNELDASLHSI